MARTNLNERSSRSHSLFQLRIEGRNAKRALHTSCEWWRGRQTQSGPGLRSPGLLSHEQRATFGTAPCSEGP